VVGTRVVKVSGHELDDPAWLSTFARGVASGPRTIVVHGGGKQINALSARLGLPVVKINGLRVTTPEVAEAVQMVLCGPVRSRLVAALRAAGLEAVGISGADGGLLEARITDADLGRVGEVVRVAPALLESLIAGGFTPVVAPVCADQTGPLNVNADEAATALALALAVKELLFISDVPGVLVDGVPQASLVAREVEGRIAAGDVKDGMAVKLRCAVRALQGGVAVVRIGDLRALTDPLAGTRLLSGAAHPA